MYVPSLSVSAQRENNKRFIHEIGKEGNVNIFFYENGKNCIYSHDVSVNRCADVYNRCADQEGVSGRGWISHFRENSNLFHSHCKVTGNKPLISTANKLPLENIYVQLKPQKLLQVKFRCIVSESVS